MTASLPPSVRDYFSGKNTRDFATAVSGFAPSAVVKDEGNDHTGAAAIRTWMEATSAKYDDKAEVVGVSSHGDNVEVTAEVSGTFRGSPILLKFSFTIEGDRIIRLEIRT